VIIAGGGLAGLAAAAALGRAGFEVDLHESRPFLGGRATSFPVSDSELVDNCQHVLLGCCTNLVDFYRRIGVEEKIRWFDRLVFVEPGGRQSVISPSWLPAPFHTAPAFLRADSLSFADKMAIARALLAITASLDLRMTLNVLLEQVTRQLNVDATCILLLNPHMQTLEYSAGRGFQTSVAQTTRIRLGESFAGRAALERHTIQVVEPAQIHQSPHFAALWAGEGFAAYFGVPLIAKGEVKGVLEVFHRSPLAPEPDWLSFLETLGGQAAIAIDNAQLFDNLQRSNVDLTLAYDATIEGWSRALDLRDKETEGHTLRVTEMTERLAKAVGLPVDEFVHIRRGALLHDIGKMGVPDAILLKPGPLTDEEWVVMKKHPVYAHEMLAPIAYLKPALDIPYCHHEKWDGTGYPRGLKGEQVPLAARLFAVVDVWDALRSDRTYRPGWPEEKVVEHIKAASGSHFDPKVAQAFLNVIG